MHTVCQPIALLGKLIVLALMALVAVFLLPPVLALVGMLLALAGMLLSALFPLLLVGLLVWLIQYLLQESRPVARPLMKNITTGTVRNCQAAALGCCRGAGWLVRQSFASIRRLSDWSVLAIAKARDFSWRVSGVMLETACGAVVLGTLAGLTKGNLPGRHQGGYIAIAILVGLVVGLMVGLANYLPERNCNQE